MIWLIAPRQAFEEWFNRYHPSSLPEELLSQAAQILRSAGTGAHLEDEIAEFIQRSRPTRGRQYAEAQAVCAIYYQESGQLDRAREYLSNALESRLTAHEQAVLSWMMGTVDLLRGRNLQAYRSLRDGVNHFVAIHQRKRGILERRREELGEERYETLRSHYVGWYDQQINSMNKSLAGIFQQALDWLNLKKWGHIRPTTAEWVGQMNRYLEHADPSAERALLGILEAGTQKMGTRPGEHERTSRMRARLERGDPAKVREVVAELLRLAYTSTRGTDRDEEFGNPPRLGSTYLELPEVLVICAWGFYEICDYDASMRLLREAIQWFSVGSWMQPVARWMLGIVCQQMPGSELDGLAEWQHAAQQMEEHAWRASRMHDAAHLAHFETISSIMRVVLQEPDLPEIPDPDMSLHITRINMVMRTDAARFQQPEQQRFLELMGQTLNTNLHELRITRLTTGSLLVTIQLPLEQALRLLSLYLNCDNRLLALPEFHLPGIECLPEEMCMGENLDHMEDELKSISSDPEVGYLLRQRRRYLEKLLELQDQRAQLSNPNRATVDIQYDERHYYDLFVEINNHLRDTYHLNRI
jgi:tetratricopeptide (TPR) repeat protein